MSVADNRRSAATNFSRKEKVMNKEAVGTLTGKFFHSVGLDRKTIEWQGTFLGLASPGLYRVQLFEWIDGQPSEQRLVPATDMRYWLIYESAEAMNNYYQEFSKRLQTTKAAQ
jgi:hypothetical protein